MARVRLRAHIRRAKGNCDESGMTLLELVVAFLIFGILMLGIAHTMGSALSMTRTNRHRSVAANLASERMDTIRSMDFASIAASTQTVDIDGITYTVDTSRYWVPKTTFQRAVQRHREPRAPPRRCLRYMAEHEGDSPGQVGDDPDSAGRRL